MLNKDERKYWRGCMKTATAKVGKGEKAKLEAWRLFVLWMAMRPGWTAERKAEIKRELFGEVK